MNLIVDPSALLSLALTDEDADYANSVLDAIVQPGARSSEMARSEALAPSIFWYEIRNVLVINERRGRLTQEQSSIFLAALEDLPIRVVHGPSEPHVLQLARAHALSVYDAAYLDLASRMPTGTLATLDTKLRAAAAAVDVAIFGAATASGRA